MRWVLEWDNGTVYFFYIGRIGLVTMPQRCQWDTVSCDVWPGMSKNHLWLCFGDVLTSTRQWLLTDCTPIQLPFWPWRNLDTAVLQSFCVNGTDWFLRNVIDQFNLQFLANVQSFCCWWALNYQSIKELLRPAGQKMQLLDCPIFNCSEVITTTQFATDSYKAIIMGWFWQSWVDILAPNLRLAPGKEFWFNSIQVWPSHLHHKQATQYFERSHCNLFSNNAMQILVHAIIYIFTSYHKWMKAIVDSKLKQVIKFMLFELDIIKLIPCSILVNSEGLSDSAEICHNWTWLLHCLAETLTLGNNLPSLGTQLKIFTR